MKVCLNFKVKAGEHRSTALWRPFFTDSVKFSTVFDSSQDFKDESGQINKLFGFADGCLDHHKSSIRIGYANERKGWIKLYAYWYDNGIRKFKTIGFAQSGKEEHFEIRCTRNSYMIYRDNTVVHIASRTPGSRYRYKHFLYPYVGGSNTYNHTVKYRLCFRKIHF